MEVNTRSQFGLPKWVGARRDVMASFSAPTSWTYTEEKPIQQIDRKKAGESTYNDVGHVILFDLRGKVYVDLNPVLGVLFFNSLKQRVEPLCRSKVTDDPGEVNLHMCTNQLSVESNVKRYVPLISEWAWSCSSCSCGTR